MNALVPIGDMERMAKAIAASGLFGMKRPEEALALMIVAEAEGRHPGSVAAEYHVIQGRPALKADAMLARFQQAGGKVAWDAYTDDKVSAVFTHEAGGSVKIEWTMDRAKKAGLGGKDNWTKYPRQMLRARVISEGVRTCFPAVCVGVYTPEEVGDFEPARTQRSKPSKEPRDMGRAEVVDPDTGEVTNPAPQSSDAARPGPSAPPANSTAGGSPTEAAGPYINADQHIFLTDLLRDLQIPTERALKKWKVAKVSELPAEKYQAAVQYLHAVHAQEIAGQA